MRAAERAANLIEMLAGRQQLSVNPMVFPLVRCNGTGTVLQIIDGVPFLAYVVDEGDKKKTIRFTRAKKYQVRSAGW